MKLYFRSQNHHLPTQILYNKTLFYHAKNKQN